MSISNVSITTPAQYGTVVWNGLSFLYTPNSGFSGTDSIVYTYKDNGIFYTATKYFNSLNTSPTLKVSDLVLDSRSTTKINIRDLISDDNLINNTLNVKIVSSYSSGTFTTDGTYIYYTGNNFNKDSEILSYIVTDLQYDVPFTLNVRTTGGITTELFDLNGYSNAINKYATALISNSANWNSMYSSVCGNSANWTIDNNIVLSLASTTEVVKNNVLLWNYSTNSLGFSTQSANNVEMYNLVHTKSSYWDSVNDLLPYINSLNLVSANSSNFNSLKIYTDLLSAQSAKNVDVTNLINNELSSITIDNTLYNIICANSANWNQTYNLDIYNTILDIITSNSAKYIYSTNFDIDFTNQKDNNDLLLTNITSNSSNWNDRYKLSSYDYFVNYLNYIQPLYVKISNFVSEYENQKQNNITLYDAITSNYNYWTSKNPFSASSTLLNLSGDLLSNYLKINSLYNDFISQKDNNINIYSLVSSQSSNWNSTIILSAYDLLYNFVLANSSNYNNFSEFVNKFNNQKDNNLNLYSLVTSGSADWNLKSAITSYDALYNFVITNSANLNSLSDFTDKFGSQKDNNLNIYSLVTSESSNWNLKSAITGYDVLYNFVTANSALYNTMSLHENAYNALENQLSNFNSLVTSQSSNWNLKSSVTAYDLLYNFVTANSSNYYFLSHFLNEFNNEKDNNLNIYSLVTSESSNWNLKSSVTAYDFLYNFVTANSSNYELISEFQSEFNNEKDNNLNIYSLVTSESSNWNLKSVITGYDVLYNFVTANSSNYELISQFQSEFNNEKDNNLNSYSLVTSESSNWNFKSSVTGYSLLYNFVTANSANYKFLLNFSNEFNSESGNNTNAYSLVSSQSSAWTNKIRPSNFDDMYNFAVNANYDTNQIYYDEFNSQKDNNLNLYTYISSNSAYWNSKVFLSAYDNLLNFISANSSVYSILSAFNLELSAQQSDNINSYNILCANSAYWNTKLPWINYRIDIVNYFNSVKPTIDNIAIFAYSYPYLSGNFDIIYNAICALSSNWENKTISLAPYEQFKNYILNNYDELNSTGDFLNSYSQLTANNDSTYYTYLSNIDTWNSKTPLEQFNDLTNFIRNPSYDTLSSFDVVATQQLSNNSAAYNILCSNSAAWNGKAGYGEYDTFANTTSLCATVWDNFYQNSINLYDPLLNTYSGIRTNIDNLYKIYNFLINKSDIYNSTGYTLTDRKDSWDLYTTQFTAFSAKLYLDQINWISLYTIIQDNAYTNFVSLTVIPTLTANQVYWYSATNTYNNYSNSWKSLTSKSNKYYSLYNTLTSNSSNYNSISASLSGYTDFDQISANTFNNSSQYLTGSYLTDYNARNLYTNENLTIAQTLTVYGIITLLNTEISDISGFTIINNDNYSDCLYVAKRNGVGALLNCYSNNSSIFYANRTGSLGIGLSSSKLIGLTVNGNISADGWIYPILTPKYFSYSTLSSIYDLTYTWMSSNSSTITDLSGTFDRYNNFYNFLPFGRFGVQIMNGHSNYSGADWIYTTTSSITTNPPGLIVNTYYSLIYKFYFIPSTTEVYTFETSADDGSYLIVNGTLLFNFTNCSTQNGSILLTAHQPVYVEWGYTQYGGGIRWVNTVRTPSLGDIPLDSTNCFQSFFYSNSATAFAEKYLNLISLNQNFSSFKTIVQNSSANYSNMYNTVTALTNTAGYNTDIVYRQLSSNYADMQAATANLGGKFYLDFNMCYPLSAIPNNTIREIYTAKDLYLSSYRVLYGTESNCTISIFYGSPPTTLLATITNPLCAATLSGTFTNKIIPKNNFIKVLYTSSSIPVQSLELGLFGSKK